MRIVLANLLKRSPFENTFKHAAKVAQCGPIFVEAVQAYFRHDRDEFEILKEEIRDIEKGKLIV